MKTCVEVPLGGVLSGVHWPPLSPEPSTFSELFDNLEGLWRAGQNLWGVATGWGPVWGPLTPTVPRTSSLKRAYLEHLDYLERLWRAGVNLWGGATGSSSVWGPLAPTVPRTSSV